MKTYPIPNSSPGAVSALLIVIVAIIIIDIMLTNVAFTTYVGVKRSVQTANAQQAYYAAEAVLLGTLERYRFCYDTGTCTNPPEPGKINTEFNNTKTVTNITEGTPADCTDGNIIQVTSTRNRVKRQVEGCLVMGGGEEEEEEEEPESPHETEFLAAQFEYAGATNTEAPNPQNPNATPNVTLLNGEVLLAKYYIRDNCDKGPESGKTWWRYDYRKNEGVEDERRAGTWLPESISADNRRATYWIIHLPTDPADASFNVYKYQGNSSFSQVVVGYDCNDDFNYLLEHDQTEIRREIIGNPLDHKYAHKYFYNSGADIPNRGEVNNPGDDEGMYWIYDGDLRPNPVSDPEKGDLADITTQFPYVFYDPVGTTIPFDVAPGDVGKWIQIGVLPVLDNDLEGDSKLDFSFRCNRIGEIIDPDGPPEYQRQICIVTDPDDEVTPCGEGGWFLEFFDEWCKEARICGCQQAEKLKEAGSTTVELVKTCPTEPDTPIGNLVSIPCTYQVEEQTTYKVFIEDSLGVDRTPFFGDLTSPGPFSFFYEETEP